MHENMLPEATKKKTKKKKTIYNCVQTNSAIWKLSNHWGKNYMCKHRETKTKQIHI